MFILKLSGLLIDFLVVSPKNVVKAIGMIFFIEIRNIFITTNFHLYLSINTV